MTEQASNVDRRRIAIIKPTDQFLQQAGIQAQKLNVPIQEQLVTLVSTSTANQELQPKEERPEYLVFDASKEEFLRAAEATLGLADDAARTYFQSLTLVNPNAEVNHKSIDPNTGIRIIDIKKGQTPFPIHPTPNS